MENKGYITEDTGYNCWFRGTWKGDEGPTQLIPISMQEGNALIGHISADEFVMLMNELVCALWPGEARDVSEGLVLNLHQPCGAPEAEAVSKLLIGAWEAEKENFEAGRRLPS